MIPRPRFASFSAHREFDGVELDTAIIQRDQIALNEVVPGPAIIEEATATTLIPPRWQGRIIAGGHLTLTRKTTGA